MNKRNYVIDFWKVIFAIMILICHSAVLPTASIEGGQIAPISYLGVEFFFIVSGYFMMASIKKKKANEQLSDIHIGEETIKFVVNKYKGLLPYALFSFFVYLLIIIFAMKPSSEEFIDRILSYFWDFSGLRIVGFRGKFEESAIGGFWYISAMMVSMLLLYPIARRKTEFFTNYLSLVIAIFALGYICIKYGKLSYSFTWEEQGIFSVGLVRALGEICLGSWCFGIANKLSKVDLTKLAKIVLTILEWGAFISVLVMMFLCENGYKAFITLPLFTIGIILALSKQTLTETCFRLPIFKNFGTFSLCLYLNHFNWIKLFKEIRLPYTFKEEFILYVILSVTSTFICMYGVKFIKYIWSKNVEKVKSIFIKK